MQASSGRSRGGCATDSPTTDRQRRDGEPIAPERLDRYLVRLGFAPSRRAAIELIAGGRVRVNGRHCRKGAVIAPGDAVVLEEAPGVEALAPNPARPLDVLFTDPAIVIVNKPALMPCHPLRPGETGTVMNSMAAAFPETVLAGDNPREGGLVHRLDNGTSGALMVARNHEAFLAIRAALRAGRVTRRYRALFAGRLGDAIEISTPIAHHPKNSRKMVVVEASGGSGRAVATAATRHRSQPRPAVTRVVPLDYANGFTLAEVTPRTGSRHQIRVHLASIGHPLAGDALYGGPALAGLEPGRFWLHLAEIEFESPAGGAVRALAPLADDLERSLAGLRLKL